MPLTTLWQQYQQALTNGELIADAAQAHAVQVLQQLQQQLMAASTTAPTASPRGLYLWGPVGRGKTMLMDWFYQSLPTPRKIRLHFHHFMRRVHQQLADLQGQPNPLALLAADWASQYQVLCFDEFFVEDIGDAMLLGTLWRELFAREVLLVTTSNAPPEQLYRNGLQRSRFLPAIALLQQHCQVLELDNGTDHRRRQSHDWPRYRLASEPAAGIALLRQLCDDTCRDSQWTALTCDAAEPALAGATAGATLTAGGSMQLLGRPLQYLWQQPGYIGFDFMQLCSGPRSQLDYITLCQQYRCIALANIPLFSAQSDTAILHGVEENYQREHSSVVVSKLDNEARRFIALVDECYDNQVLLLCTGAVLPDALYQASQLSFAFARTVSRLFEMQLWPLTVWQSGADKQKNPVHHADSRSATNWNAQ